MGNRKVKTELQTTNYELLVIVGPTASGKSALALKIAKEFNGEIICADSRTVYKGMDIGTAKPSKDEQKLIPHWSLDLVELGERFSAAAFKKYAEAAIKDIHTRDKLPILVGGTGLYIDSVIFDYAFTTRINFVAELEDLSVDKLRQIIKEKKYPMPENFKNKRYLINSIRRRGKVGTKKTSLDGAIILIGLMPSDEVLRQRIGDRAEAIFEAGVIEETRTLLKKHGHRALLKTGGIVYKICLEIIAGTINQPEAIEKFKIADWQYARRQYTWFKRNKFIHWFSSKDQAYEYIKRQLNT